ncbi:pentatricopeptide repeat-containing protein-like [Dorcoceras hygrometricum]|uniref:Pentatricopeptide repeat-containing protein-like n=1 Tax=Dorcoceras hygrometricum TaxID=472368 RepID=A0A2Z7A3J3_9LAMI|nr:pentatricopeptide repeat-containing protein-like [Dorcoceras hygrometricum]
MSASGESSTTMDRLLHASGSHPIPTPGDPKTNSVQPDLGLIHSTNGNHLESPNEGSSIDHQGKPVVIAQEAVHLQTVVATTDASVEQLSVPKRKSQKRKGKFILEDAIEVDAPVPASVEQPAMVPVVEGTTEDPDTVINQVLNQLDSISGDKDDKQSDRAETWFDRAFDEMLLNDSPVVKPSDIDEEEETIDVGAAGGDQQVQFCVEGTTDDEILSIEEHQARIPFNASLPSTLAPTIGDLVDYIRSGDAKKGEGSSSRRPIPTPVTQGESSGNVIRTTEIISQTDIDTAQRDIMERMMRADRERDRERRERRLRLSIDTSLETGIAGFEEREVVAEFVGLRDCGPVACLFFNSFGFELVIASAVLPWSCMASRLELVAAPFLL